MFSLMMAPNTKLIAHPESILKDVNLEGRGLLSVCDRFEIRPADGRKATVMLSKTMGMAIAIP